MNNDHTIENWEACEAIAQEALAVGGCIPAIWPDVSLQLYRHLAYEAVRHCESTGANPEVLKSTLVSSVVNKANGAGYALAVWASTAEMMDHAHVVNDPRHQRGRSPGPN